jgi:hypothetical protein
MNRYDPRTPRTALAVAAAATTALTLAVAVFAPARMEFRTREVQVLAATGASLPVTTVVAGQAAPVASVDLVAAREPKPLPAPAQPALRLRPQES